MSAPLLVTESDYLQQLKSRWPQGGTASREVLSLAAEAVRDFPESAALWFLRGQLLVLAPVDYIFSKLDAICSFQKASEIDPAFAEAYEQFSRSEDGARADPEQALEYYRKAAARRGKPRGES